jgi:glyoxylase-like metal-dependent hydrolase (beta-lactamase superfamily II)
VGDPLQFDRTFKALPGEVVEIRPGIRRITAPNPGPMTFTGTNSYLVGTGRLAVIDPGPPDEAHLAALQAAIGETPVDAILVTHTHKDHSPLARRLKAMTGAPILGAGPHSFARSVRDGDASLDVAVDQDHAPDQVLGHGARIDAGGGTVEVVATPGHTVNHLCFALAGSDVLFSGDHVMAWSTSLVAPPDGDMSAYLQSLQLLLTRRDTLYLPGHGAKLNDPLSYVEALFGHRMDRETAILAALECDSLSVSSLVDRLYEGLDPRLRGAAGLSVLAHLERLEALGQASQIAGSDTLWQAGTVAFDSRD